MHELYELKEMLMNELEEYGRKGELTGGTLEVVDKLAHAVKNICKIIEAYEEEEGEYSMASGRSYERGGQGGGSNRGGQGGGSNRGGSYRGGGQSRRGNRSYARGRGGNSRNIGRYSSEGGYSGADEMEEMVESIRNMMDELPEEVQRDAQRFVQKLEQQMM